MHSRTIVIIEDEPSIAENLIHVLEMENYQVKWFETGEKGLAHLKESEADLLVLDVGLPDCNGFDLCKTIRRFSSLPIIFLTARNDELDRVIGLEIGADDYVTKPFSPREMLARIKLRIKDKPTLLATDSVSAKEANHDDLVEANFDYCIQGEALGLTAVEFKILHKLIERADKILSREQLMIAADMAPEAIYERNIDTHIKAIRHKLKPYALADRIGTKRGFGYFYSMKG